MIDKITNWAEIDWEVVNRNVKEIRGKIYQAKIDGKFKESMIKLGEIDISLEKILIKI